VGWAWGPNNAPCARELEEGGELVAFADDWVSEQRAQVACQRLATPLRRLVLCAHQDAAPARQRGQPAVLAAEVLMQRVLCERERPTGR
jgi:hypothetical protein